MKPTFCKNSAEVCVFYTKQNPKKFAKLKLQKHMVCKKKCREQALRLFDFYFKSNPAFNISKLLEDENAVCSYNSWKKLNSINSILTENFSVGKEKSEKRGQSVVKSVFSKGGMNLD
jgi:hypothetical protein